MDFGTTLAALLFLPCIATTTTFSLPSLARTLDVVLPSNYTGNTSYQGQTFHNSKVESVLRTQRDLAYNTTIDRILWPAVSLSTAYFNKDFSTKKIGNVTSLLFMGYRRLVIDLYWDGSKGTWQLCPTTNVSFITTTTSSSPLSATATSDNSVITTTTSTPTTTPELVKRDIASSDQTIAGVVCPPDPHLRYLLSTLNTYMSSTSMNLNSDSSRYTDLLFLVLNLHDLHLSPSLSSPLYNLTSVNTNLTLTRLFPDPLVFSLRSALLSTFNSTNMLFTPANQNSTSTWPLWSTLVQNDLRVIVSFGVTDLSANTTYNVTADQDVVFPATAMNAGVGMANLTAPAWPDPNNCSVPVKGVVMVPGPNETAIELGAISNGEIEMSWNWAYMSDGGAAGFAFGVEQNLTACGYSPYLTSPTYIQPNTSLELASAVLGTIWSWDVGEPAESMPAPFPASGTVTLNCAAMQRANGRWKAQDCTAALPVACRSGTDVNKWTITKLPLSYDRAEKACLDINGYQFDVPRTAQQNLLLWQFVVTAAGATGGGGNGTGSGDIFWINWNNVRNTNCWVTGKDTTCWWDTMESEDTKSLIYTSTIGGVIVLLIMVFFVWLKGRKIWRSRKYRDRRQKVKEIIKLNEFVTTPA